MSARTPTEEGAPTPPVPDDRPPVDDRFRLLAESAPVGIVETDAEGTHTFVNDRWRWMTGCDDPVPIPWARAVEVIHHDDRRRFGEVAATAFGAGQEFDTTVRLRPGAPATHARVQGRPVTDADGRLRGYMGTVIDLTELVEATDALQRSEQRYRELVATAPVGRAVYTVDGTLTEVNRAWAHLLGYEPDEVLGTNAVDHVHPDDRAGAREAGRRLVVGEVDHVSAERRLLRADGSAVWVSSTISPERDADGRLVCFHSLVIDISDRKEAELDLRRREERYRRLVQEAPVPQLVATLDGRLVEVNEAFVAIMGATREELLRRSPGSLVKRADWPVVMQGIERLLSGEIEYFESERRLRRPDGSLVWVIGGTSLVRDGDEVLLHTVMQDITERKATEEALRASESRYRDVVEALHDGVLVYSTTELLASNRAARHLLGFSAEELAAVDTYDRMDPIRPDGSPIPLGERAAIVAMQTGRPVLGEVTGLLVPGRGRRWFNTNVLPRRDGDRVVGGVVTLSDITDQREAEERLRHSEERYRGLVEQAPLGYLATDATGTITQANRRIGEIVGTSSGIMLGRAALDWVHPEDRDALGRDLASLLAGERPRIEAEHRLRRVDGTTVWVAISITVLTGTGTGAGTEPPPRPGAGDPGGDDGAAFVILVQDISERRQALEALHRSEVRFRTLAESLPIGIVHAGPDGVVDFANPRWLEITGIEADRIAETDPDEVIHPDDRTRVREALVTAFHDRTPFHVQYRIVRPDGSVRWLSGRGARTYDPDSGEHTGLVGSVEDITPLIEARKGAERLAAIVESASDLVAIVDWPTGRYIYLNAASRQLLGLSEADVRRTDFRTLLGPEAAQIAVEELLPALERHGSWSGEMPLVAADGSTVHVWQKVVAERAPDGTIRQLASVGRDVTDRKRFEDELAWRATHDPLTQLPNRALLLDHLELALARARREDHLVAMLFLDLDRMKLVNDTLGHEAGDELLRETATRLRAAVRPADTVARLGGDEFVILAEDVDDADHALDLAERIAATISGRPFPIGERGVHVTGSIGLALSSGYDANPEAILRDADAAMYRAKDLGRSRIEVFDDAMRVRAARRMALTESLAHALDRGELVAHYQPCVDLTDGRVRSVEALVRWHHPERGLLLPQEFIGLAEDTGLIVGLGLDVLRAACGQARAWEAELGASAPQVHVNLSAHQLTGDLPDLVAEALHSTDLRPDLLCLEITESVLMEDAAAVIDTLGRVKDLGVALAIDDFGTGYSSLAYLHRFPVDVLKVDQSFVAGLDRNGDETVVAAIITLAHTMGLRAVAEGVERPEQLTRLRALGCDSAQGYLFAEPADAARTTPLLATAFPLR